MLMLSICFLPEKKGLIKCKMYFAFVFCCKILIILFKLNVIFCANLLSGQMDDTADDWGESIPEIVSHRNACESSKQPQVIETKTTPFAYLLSPQFESPKMEPYNCTWLIIANTLPTKKSLVTRLVSIVFRSEPSTSKLDLYEFDAPNRTILIASYAQSGPKSALRMHTKSNRLLIRFSGGGAHDPFAWRNGFTLYFEQSDPSIDHCDNSADIKCRNGRACVEASKQCDGVDDCDDGTDEEQCLQPLSNLSFTSACGLRFAQFSSNQFSHNSPQQIVNGQIVRRRSMWPWMVDLRLVDDEPDGHTCGGSIINRQWILTAAHCMRAYPDLAAWSVHAGKRQKYRPDQTEVIRYIKRYIIHPHYIGSEAQIDNQNLTWYDHNVNDIALIQLNAPLPDEHDSISAICLPPQPEIDQLNGSRLMIGRLATVIGWGRVSNLSNQNVLNEAQVPVISNEQCREWMPQFDVGSEMICAGWIAGGPDACQGDSGGPLFVPSLQGNDDENQRWTLIGIVSTGDLCGAPKQAGIYTRVSSFVQWISNFTSIDTAKH